MFKKLTISLLALSMLLTGISLKPTAITATEKQTLNIAVVTTDENNDLYKTLVANYNGIQKVSSIDAALALNTDDKTDNDVKGIMVLADNYPTTTVVNITSEQYTKLTDAGMRLYIEYPANNDVLGISYSGTGVMGHNRMVVTNKDAFGFDKEQYILYAHGAQFVKKSPTLTSDKKTVANPEETWLVSAKIAGYDTASFGLTDCTPYSLLDVNNNVMVATTKFSQFISARYAPYNRWQNIWDGILEWLVQGDVNTLMEWQPLVDTAYEKDESLGSSNTEILEAYKNAVDENTQWYLNSGIMPNSDGTQGIYECFHSGNKFDIYGNQGMRTQLRSDCMGESAGNIALAGVILNNDEYKQVARNVMDYLLLVSINSQAQRADEESSEFGLLSWDEGNQRVYYGDDNAKAILGMISAAAALEEDKWDERILQAILGNFRTTGVYGFRGNRLEGANLANNGWEYYFNSSTVNYASHYESLLWACYLWAYDKTGYEPLLQRTKTAIDMMMDAYVETMKLDADNGSGEWIWTNGMQQERAKMLLSLAWLYRIEPTQEHADYIDLMISDMMQYQDAATGALQDRFGTTGEGKGKYGPFTTNSAYGNHEAPVIQENGDPCSDSLYTSAFAMLSLNEAVAATGNATYKAYSDALNNYFVKIQQTSTNAKYDGVWFRGFDYDKWETYGSDGDAAWGIWATETGWSQAWISNTLSMKVLNTNLWDYSKTTTVADHFEENATLMLNYDPNVLVTTITSNVALNKGVDILNDEVYGSTTWNDGKWSGNEGNDITLTFDFAEEKTFNEISLGFIHSMASGISLPDSATFYVSNDKETWTKVGTYEGIYDETTTVQSERDDAATVGSYIKRVEIALGTETKARYVKVEIENPGQFLHSGKNAYVDTWIFMDEFDINITDPTLADLYTLIKASERTDTSAYTSKTVNTFLEALEDAKEVYANKEDASEAEIDNAYNTLKEAKAGLKEPLPVIVYSVSNQKNTTSKDVLTDGNYAGSYVSWNLISNLKAYKNGADPQNTTGEVILDLQEITDIDSIGYTAQSRWRSGIFSQQATFYVSDTLDGEWKEIGHLGGKVHEGDYTVDEYHDYATAIDEDVTGRYVKVVFERDGQYDGTEGPVGKMYAEWLYVTEIGINRFYAIKTSDDGNGSVSTSTHERGAVRGEDVTVTLTPNVGYVVDTLTVDGTTVEVSEENTYVIENVMESHTVEATFKEKTFPEAELPTLHVHDWFVVDTTTFDPLLEVSAFDKNGKDITSSIEVVDSTVEPFPGTYKVTYQVKDEVGAKRKATVNVYVVREEALEGNNVIAITPSTTDTLGTMSSQLLDGLYAAGTSHSNAEYVSWQNIKTVDVIIDLDESSDIASLGYSTLSNPRMGLFKSDVEFYVCDTLGTTWTKVGSVDADKHESAIDAYEIEKNIIDVNASGRYVKVVFKFDETEENLAPYRNVQYQNQTRTFKPEWLFVDEIMVNEYYKVNTGTLQNGSVNVTYDHEKGALAGEDVIISFTPEEGYVLGSVSVNGSEVEVSDNTYTITGISENCTVDVTFVVDYSALEEMLEIAKSVDTSKYTEESVSVLKDAIESAEKALLDGSAKEVLEAENMLADAYNGLEEMKEEPKPTPTPEGTNTGDVTNVGGLLTMMIAALGVLLASRRKKA